MRIRGGEVLFADQFKRIDIGIEGGVIQRGGGDQSIVLDAEGLHVLPGIVDIHGDAFERQIMPRPGVAFEIDVAMLDTTAYLGLTWSWEGGARGTEAARALVDAVERLRPAFMADTHVHLRHETFNLDAEAEIIGWIEARRVACLAFNDHMAGTIKDRSRPNKVARMVERSGLDQNAFMELVDRTHARRESVPASIERIAGAGRKAGLPMLSHDDMSPELRTWFRGLGCRIAEFPINEETAFAARDAGDEIVFGAPNVVRGGSHTGCPTAANMVAASACSALASDYYYPALPLAPFRLDAAGVLPLAESWRLVSAGPARMLGLKDRGVIADGKRADVVLATAEGRIVAVIAAGRLRLLTDLDRVSTRRERRLVAEGAAKSAA
jgi:alpha-D-ribose 1-methylphosphonate 5-triphosphate diphosphatase